MLLGVFTHVEADEFDTQFLGKHLCHFSLTYAGRTYEEHARHGFAVVGKSRFRHLYCLYEFLDGFILTENLRLDALFKRCERLKVVALNRHSVDLCHIRQSLVYSSHLDAQL